MLMISDENREFKGPKAIGGCPITLMIYVEDVDKVFAQALKAGAAIQRPLGVR